MLIEQRLGAVFLRTLRSTLLLLKHLLAARRHLDDELRLTRLISRFGEDLVDIAVTVDFSPRITCSRGRVCGVALPGLPTGSNTAFRQGRHLPEQA